MNVEEGMEEINGDGKIKNKIIRFLSFVATAARVNYPDEYKRLKT